MRIASTQAGARSQPSFPDAPRGAVFVTGATGFIGSAVMRAAIASGYAVDALTRSHASAALLRAQGANPVIGDLGDRAGAWAIAANRACWVIHLAQPQTFGGRVTNARARRYASRRLAFDKALMDALDPARVRRVVYVAGTSYYGECGPDLRDEDAAPNPKGWGPYLAPAIESLPDFVARGLPITIALPGWVYGPGSWFAEYVLAPLHAGRPVTGLRGGARMTSPVHVDDCARALVHLLATGETGRRYFIVDDEPAPGERLVERAAEALGVKGRGRRAPFFVVKLLAGRVIAESLAYENRLSNARLKATGFSFTYPTYRDGVPAAVRAWQDAMAGRSRTPDAGERVNR